MLKPNLNYFVADLLPKLHLKFKLMLALMKNYKITKRMKLSPLNATFALIVHPYIFYSNIFFHYLCSDTPKKWLHLIIKYGFCELKYIDYCYYNQVNLLYFYICKGYL